MIILIGQFQPEIYKKIKKMKKMKNLLTFDEFLNESQLNEALVGAQKTNAKKIGDMTKAFFTKDLPALAARFDCEVTEKRSKGEFKIFRGEVDLIDISSWAMGRNRFASIVAYVYPSYFSREIDSYRNVVPFSVGSGTEAENKAKGMAEMISNWQSGPYDFLEDADSVKTYDDWLTEVLEGIAENLEFFKSKGVI